VSSLRLMLVFPCRLSRVDSSRKGMRPCCESCGMVIWDWYTTVPVPVTLVVDGSSLSTATNAANPRPSIHNCTRVTQVPTYTGRHMVSWYFMYYTDRCRKNWHISEWHHKMSQQLPVTNIISSETCGDKYLHKSIIFYLMAVTFISNCLSTQ